MYADYFCQRNSMKKYLKIGAAGGVALLLIFAAMAFSYGGSTGDGQKQVEFEVKSGWGANVVIARLHKEKLIKSRTYFKLLLTIRGQKNSLKRGIYTINDGMSSGEIIDVLTSGRTKTIAITLPEGLNNRQIGDRLVTKGFFASRDEFLAMASNKEILTKFKIPAKTTEGYLFPETYNFPKNYDKKKIVEKMVQTFIDKTKSIEGFPTDPKARHDLVILASIVEREAQLKEERSLIAGVFANRLEANYPLESCATIQYLFDKPRKRIYFRDLERPSPYNTYINRGLPPGPISNPGKAAIKASLKPEETNYKFFVVKGDGSHHFSRTFNEHVRAKNRYIPRK